MTKSAELLTASLEFLGQELCEKAGRMKAQMSGEAALQGGIRNSNNAIRLVVALSDQFRVARGDFFAAYNDVREKRIGDDARLNEALYAAVDRYFAWAETCWPEGNGNHSVYVSNLGERHRHERNAVADHIRRPRLQHITKRFPICSWWVGMIAGAICGALISNIPEIIGWVGRTF